VLIIPYGSIQGPILNFILPKSRSIQPSRTQNLLSYHGVNVTERLPLKILSSWSLWDKLKINLCLIWTNLNGSYSGENNLRKTIKITFMHNVLHIFPYRLSALTLEQNVLHYFRYEPRYSYGLMTAHWFDSIMECSTNLRVT
jgi:hypothetical protein